MTPTELSIRLRDCRLRAGLLQRHAAKRSGIGWRSISSWESGRAIRSLTVENLLRLLVAYEVSPEHFFDERFEERW